MADVNALPLANYAAGTYPIASTAIADSVTFFRASVARCTSADPTIWPNVSDTITFTFEYSLDNGATWRPWFSGSSPGGIYVIPKTGLEAPAMLVEQAFPAGVNRRVRGTVVLSAAIRTSATLTVL